MGWNSWNYFAGKVTDADIRSAADALVSTGMRDAGYVYVVLDDTWQGKRDESGVLHPNAKFPDMKALGDYVHSKKLKFGIYSSPGSRTCENYEGSRGHEAQDAAMYASWGVDFLKYDLCSLHDDVKQIEEGPHGKVAAREEMIDSFRKMHVALQQTGHPVVYSISTFSNYALDEPWKWGGSVGANLWRTTDDIYATYGRVISIGFSQARLSKFAGHGHWNDPDMLEIGNGKMTPDQYKLHMTLWAILAAPLFAGNNLRAMTDADKIILMNRDAIAIDQDPLGKQGDRLYESGDLDVWTKPLSSGRTAIALFNRSGFARDVSIDLSSIGYSAGAELKDVWRNASLGHHSGVFTAEVPSEGAVLLTARRRP